MAINYGNSVPATEAESVRQAVGPMGPQTAEGVQSEIASANQALASNELKPHERAAVQQYRDNLLKTAKPPAAINYGDSTPVVDEAPRGEPVRSTLDRVWSGFKQGSADLAAGAAKVVRPVLAVNDAIVDAATGRPLGAGNRERYAGVEGFAKEHGANNWTSVVNQAAPEVALTASPLTRASSALAGQAAPMATRVLADMAVNATYEGAKGVINQDPHAATNSAMAGVASAVPYVPRVLKSAATATASAPARVVAPLVARGASDSARQLAEAGVRLTPGQAMGGIVEGFESAATALPLAGRTVANAQRNAVKDYAQIEVNNALAPLGVTLSRAKSESIEAFAKRADDLVGDVYDTVKPRTFLSADAATQAMKQVEADISQMPLLGPTQFGYLLRYIENKIGPALANGRMSGETFKEIDSEIGKLARRFERSDDPMNAAAGEAWRSLQTALRSNLSAVDDQALQLLQRANASHRLLLPIKKAVSNAAAKVGEFTPVQLHRAAQKFGVDLGPLNDAAREVLSGVRDQGAGWRTGVGVAGLGTGAGKALIPASILVQTLYSERGLNTIMGALRSVEPEIAAQVASAPPEVQQKVLEQILQTMPAVAARIGASLGEQQPEGVTP